MQALGDHLGADEDINLAGAEIAQDAAVIVLAFHGIGVHAADARVREEFGQGVLDLLRAGAGEADGRVAAFLVRAERRDRFDVAANVAGQVLLDAMVGEGDAAIGAIRDEAASRALQRGGVTAPVQEQDGLLAPFEPLVDGFLELRREDGTGLFPSSPPGACPRRGRAAFFCRPPVRAIRAAYICRFWQL